MGVGAATTRLAVSFGSLGAPSEALAGSLRAAHSQDSEPGLPAAEARSAYGRRARSGRQLACQEDKRGGCGADAPFGSAVLDGGAPSVSSRGSPAEARR